MLVEKQDKKYIAKSYLFDDNNNEIANCSGIFMRSNHLLKDAIGFKEK